MAVNQTKARAPDLSPTPEESVVSDVEDKSKGGAFSRSRSALNLHIQERLLSCGNFDALLDDDDRMGRRPSVGSLSVDGSTRDRDNDEGGYFSIQLSPSDKSLLNLRRGSVPPPQRRSYVIGIVGDNSVEKSSLMDLMNSSVRRANLPSQRFVELNTPEILKIGRVSWPSVVPDSWDSLIEQNQPTPDAILLCKDASSTTAASRDPIGPLIDALKSLSCLLFVLLLRSPASTPSITSQTSSSLLSDPLNDPLISRAFSQQTKIRFLRVGPAADDIQHTLKDVLTILDQEIPKISPTRSRGGSYPLPYSRNNSVTGITITPNLERRGSEASSRQTHSLSSKPPNPSPVLPQVIFQKARPFQLVLNRERAASSSPPQSPKALRPPSTLDSNLCEPVSQEFLSSRFQFAIPSLPGTKPVDPPSPAGTASSPPGSQRQSRLLDSESDFGSSDITGEQEKWMADWPSEEQDEFARALEGLNLTGDGGGMTWNELIDRLLSPGIPGEGTVTMKHSLIVDDDFIFTFLVFYRKFAAPCNLLRSLIAKFKEATDFAIDYMLQMILQTRCCDIITRWLLTHPNDFCHPETHAEARAFILSLEETFILAHYTSELIPVIDKILPLPENDPDRFWGRTDDNPDYVRDDDDFESSKGTQSAPLSPNGGGTPARKRSLPRSDPRNISKEDGPSHYPQFTTPFSRNASINPSEPPSPDFSRTASQSTVATMTTIGEPKESLQRIELVRSHSDVPYSWMDFGRDGKGFEPFFIGGRERKESSASNLSGSSIKDNIRRMTAFWDATPEQIAITLTKLEWEYFIALEPRDIPRHMWTPEGKRDPDSPMERIVYHFNHVAKWVACTILYSPKLKDRVRDLEKMLRIAIELRNLNNYDTLFALISGLQNQSVHRLAKTFEEVKKIELEQIEEGGRKRSQGSIRSGIAGTLWLKYQSCCLLMARERNFSPYRMAFRNSFQSRIPWLSRHKADMMSAAAVNKTFVSPGVIKWSGFQVIGESLLSVLHCQHYPYNLLTRDEQLERAILETPDSTEQELDAKSHELEPPGKRSYSKSHSTGQQWISKAFTRR